MMHGHEKSDSVIVATKPPNKAGRPAAEAVERRAEAKENTNRCRTCRTQNRRQAVTMGPTARLIEAKNLDEATRQTIASEIEAAFAAEAAAGPIRLPATIFLVSARRPG